MSEARDGFRMHTRTALLALLLALATAAGPVVAPVASQSSMVTLDITVEAPGGDPVADADLTATWEGDSATATTTSSGRALIDVPEGADVTIEVSHPNYVRNSPYRVTDATEGEVQITVYRKASASFTVVDAEGPVEGVRVEFRKGSNDPVVSRTTDNRGQVDSGTIEAGEYTVTLFKSGYFQRSVDVELLGDVSQQLEIERGSVSLTFLVRDDNFDPPRPVGQATITGPDFSTQTQADGTRSVSVPVNSRLSVTVEKEGYRTVETTVLVRQQPRQVNFTTRKLPAVSVSVPNERVVVGEALQVTVTDQYDEPLSDAVVYLDGESVGQPDEQGVLRVPIESAGDHTLYAEYNQRSSETLTISGVEADGSTPPPTTEAPSSPDDSGGSVALPGLGDVDLGSTAVGIAAGVVLAVVLFVYVRIR